MSETWLMNETIGGITADFVMKPFPPDSNNYVKSGYTNETLFLYAASGVTQDPRAIYEYQNYDGDRVDRWFDESYRTWEFLEPPTGELLTWLQENGVKQSAGGIGLKNLSSYNQDLSVPRKKDLDALETQLDNKQPKITVNGIVQGDGAGNLSAAEVVEADVITISVLPTVTSTDDGKFLRVVSGAWAAASVPDANGGAF